MGLQPRHHLELPLTLSITTSDTPKGSGNFHNIDPTLSSKGGDKGQFCRWCKNLWRVSRITADDLGLGELSGSGFIWCSKHPLKVNWRFSIHWSFMMIQAKTLRFLYSLMPEMTQQIENQLCNCRRSGTIRPGMVSYISRQIHLRK